MLIVVDRGCRIPDGQPCGRLDRALQQLCRGRDPTHAEQEAAQQRMRRRVGPALGQTPSRNSLLNVGQDGIELRNRVDTLALPSAEAHRHNKLAVVDLAIGKPAWSDLPPRTLIFGPPGMPAPPRSTLRLQHPHQENITFF
jgi:hypothetical protein